MPKYTPPTNDAISNRVAVVESNQSSGTFGYLTLAALNADLAHPAGALARVTNDATPANNGDYIKLGAGGTGSWQTTSTSRIALVEGRATTLEGGVFGPFSITNILARTALELHDPELSILGIDPFKRISKKNLFLLGLLYKLKIVLTNFAGKFLLRSIFGRVIAGISINYIALPVECFWNGVVLIRVVREARLRLFGFALCNHIAENVYHDHLLEQLSPEAKKGCLRAIGSAIVLGRNYHPNMILLLLRFQHLLHIRKDDRYDDWDLFLQALRKVTPKERYFLLDLFTVATAFDGKISSLESKHIREAYGEFYELYLPRLLQLTHHLKAGRLHAAADLCKIDFTAG